MRDDIYVTCRDDAICHADGGRIHVTADDIYDTTTTHFTPDHSIYVITHDIYVM